MVDESQVEGVIAITGMGLISPLGSDQNLFWQALEAGESGVELIAAALAPQKQIAPPTINDGDPDPECDLDDAPNRARLCRADVAMSNSFGFGGQNACMILRRAGAVPTQRMWLKNVVETSMGSP